MMLRTSGPVPATPPRRRRLLLDVPPTVCGMYFWHRIQSRTRGPNFERAESQSTCILFIIVYSFLLSSLFCCLVSVLYYTSYILYRAHCCHFPYRYVQLIRHWPVEDVMKGHATLIEDVTQRQFHILLPHVRFVDHLLIDILF